MRLAAAVLVVVAACSRTDPDTERLHGEIRRLTDRVEELQRQLADAAPAPSMPDLHAASARWKAQPECAALLRLLNEYAACDALDEPSRAGLRTAMTMLQTTPAIDVNIDAQQMAAACTNSIAGMRADAQAHGCTLGRVEREP